MLGEELRVIDEASIGKRIKAQRRASGLTLQDVADATGLTKGYLSKVETSGKAAPVPTLARIAKALNVALADLFGDVEKDERVSLVRADQREQLARGIREFGYSYELLCVGMNNQYMEPYVLTIPRDTVCIPSQHDGEELVFVIEGTMVFHHRRSRSTCSRRVTASTLTPVFPILVRREAIGRPSVSWWHTRKAARSPVGSATRTEASNRRLATLYARTALRCPSEPPGNRPIAEETLPGGRRR